MSYSLLYRKTKKLKKEGVMIPFTKIIVDEGV